MQSGPYEFKSDFMRRVLARGREEGREKVREEGREKVREAIRSILEARAIPLGADHARTLAACTDDDLLLEWCRRAPSPRTPTPSSPLTAGPNGVFGRARSRSARSVRATTPCAIRER